MFLSANNFFWRVRPPRPNARAAADVALARQPEASLLGVQYFGNDRGGRRGALRRPAERTLRLGLGRNRASPRFVLRRFGIEIDHMTRDSPPGTTPLAEVPNPSAAAARRR